MIEYIRDLLRREREWEEDWCMLGMLWIQSWSCSQNCMVKTMLWCGTRLFSYVVTWNPPEEHGELRAMHFATSERDFNTSVRTHVEALDERYKE